MCPALVLALRFVLGGAAVAGTLLAGKPMLLGIVVNRIYGDVLDNYTLIAIPLFVLMARFLSDSGVTDRMFETLRLLMSRVRGGLALAVVFISILLAATTGIIGASITVMGVMALRPMLQYGYSARLTTGVIASSGCLGILIPPSIMLVIMSDLMSIPVGTVFIAAILPGLLLAGLYALYIIVLCRLKPHLAPPLPDDIGPTNQGEFWTMIFKSFVPPVFLIVIVLGSIFAGVATPTEAAGVGALGATLLAVLNRQLTFKVMQDVCHRSALTSAMLFGIFLGATCFSLVFRWLGGETLIDEFIAWAGVGPWGILFVLMGMIFFLGFFFDWVEITLIVLPVFGPIVSGLDFGTHLAGFEGVGEVALIWFTILVSTNLQTSFLTPPFGFALFYMKGVAPPGVTIQHIYKGIIPFVILQLIGLALCILFPGIVLWLPQVLLN